ncbi:16 kDa calcium-binding protein-like [Biomphalaria glabrata]|uniref:16 kDa calcium-binding protein-like n=1 Tax=Biomphalaria glabrata TaxID=6526 RepID=A0A9W2YXY7_BIOGL|nr:16 kDa calcium-binding protein-like [Biomphalaria glabrata]KAI8768781.1 calmodulin-2/4-like [Biomphalaria glabrata]
MPRKTSAEWAAIFIAADRDKSGKLDEKEFKEMFVRSGVQLSDHQIKNTFNYCEGNNGDKMITFDEFMKGMTKMENLIVKLTALFKKYDKDKNGQLSKQELTEVLRACGGNYTEEEIVNILDRMDSSRDGKVSLDEFLNSIL